MFHVMGNVQYVNTQQVPVWNTLCSILGLDTIQLNKRDLDTPPY